MAALKTILVLAPQDMLERLLGVTAIANPLTTSGAAVGVGDGAVGDEACVLETTGVEFAELSALLLEALPEPPQATAPRIRKQTKMVKSIGRLNISRTSHKEIM